ncbi:MAG: hypothetical protein F4218_06090 [Synechococcus sp. SB0677_bin_5]|nr:hypothetical protein [Synechococcus sp. SB0677_bin_5]
MLNAVAHRNYAPSAPIQIRVYDRRIALWNPVSLPLDWTLDKLMGAHASAPHNPAIVHALFRAGMVEAWGRGIGNIVNVCGSAGMVKPQWMLEPVGRLEFCSPGRIMEGLTGAHPMGTLWRPTGARVTDGSSSPSTDQRADVEGGAFQRLGTEDGIRATEQSDPFSHC